MADKGEHILASEISQRASRTVRAVPDQQSSGVSKESVDASRLEAADLKEVALERAQELLVSVAEWTCPGPYGSGETTLLHLPEMPKRMSQRTSRKGLGRRRRADPPKKLLCQSSIDAAGMSASARRRIPT